MRNLSLICTPPGISPVSYSPNTIFGALPHALRDHITPRIYVFAVPKSNGGHHPHTLTTQTPVPLPPTFPRRRLHRQYSIPCTAFVRRTRRRRFVPRVKSMRRLHAHAPTRTTPSAARFSPCVISRRNTCPALPCRQLVCPYLLRILRG